METDRPVYVLTLTAVYDHGCAGVFSTRQAAEAHASALWEASDGHHTFRIDEVVIDDGVWLSCLGDPRRRNGPPADYEEIGYPAGMSNFGPEIDVGIEDRLRNERVFTRYAGWNFNGKVWLDAEGSFSCQVWTYGSPVATVRADTLADLMHEVSEEWGYE